ncbi:hypothetical protein GX48_06599 [Paracoccidioides brasiliensis]|nr:hypothetical protein GX48_06599 [Paracoccidioides brasiliensis]
MRIPQPEAGGPSSTFRPAPLNDPPPLYARRPQFGRWNHVAAISRASFSASRPTNICKSYEALSCFNRRMIMKVFRTEDRLKAAQLIRDGFGSRRGAVTIYDIERSGALEALRGWKETIFRTFDMMPPGADGVACLFTQSPRFSRRLHSHVKNEFWSTGLPWQAVDFCDYFPIDEVVTNFCAQTDLQWDNTNDSPSKIFTYPPMPGPELYAFIVGSLSRMRLRIAKFAHYVLLLMTNGVPMPGTILSWNGMPENPRGGRHSPSFPNNLIQQAISIPLLGLVDLSQNALASMSMQEARSIANAHAGTVKLFENRIITMAFFNSPATSQAQKAAGELHDRADIDSDPVKGPHISAHSAVNPHDTLNPPGEQLVVLRLKSQLRHDRMQC